MAPDISIAMDFSLSRLNEIVTTMKVYPENMKKNLSLLGGLHNSQKILLKLTKKGLSRQEAYSIVQKNAMEAWNNKRNFYDVLKTDNKLLKYLSKEELKNILEIDTNNSKIDWIFKNKIK
jgi:adenylosuccinate lyase